MEFAFFPSSDHPHAIGLILDEDSSGRRTTVVDPEYLRTFVAGERAGAYLGGLAFPREKTLTSARGWPDEWPPDMVQPLYSIVEFMEGGTTWEELVLAAREWLA